MRFTDDEIDLIQSTFEAVEPLPTLFAELFFIRLVELDNCFETRFAKVDLAERDTHLLARMQSVIHHLDDPAAALPGIEALARLLHACGITAEDTPLVTEALIWTIQNALGLTFDETVEAAWRKFCQWWLVTVHGKVEDG
jgi:hemoglobin-like flavoprotein